MNMIQKKNFQTFKLDCMFFVVIYSVQMYKGYEQKQDQSRPKWPNRLPGQ